MKNKMKLVGIKKNAGSTKVLSDLIVLPTHVDIIKQTFPNNTGMSVSRYFLFFIAVPPSF